MRTLWLWLACLLCSLCIACNPPLDLTGWPCTRDADCGPDHLCTGEICLRNSIPIEARRPEVNNVNVGFPCRDAEDCPFTSAIAQGKGTCLTQAQGWTGGFCTFQCAKDIDCSDNAGGKDALCVTAGSGKECRIKCNKDEDCRVSYQCQRLSDQNASICVPL